MTKNNIKAILFASLIVAMVLPFSSMNVAEAAPEEKVNKTKQIKPFEKSNKENNLDTKAFSLFKERTNLLTDGKELRKSLSLEEEEVSTADNQKAEKIHKRIKEIRAEINQLNKESRKLFTLDANDKIKFTDAKKIVKNSDIPFKGIGIDGRNGGALMIGFTSIEQAEKYTPQIDELIDVPYYFEIKKNEDVDFGCTYLTSNCDPLMGGIKIATQKGSSWTNCSLSVPAERNVWWWTEDGFITAAHCLTGTGSDVKQPSSSSSKIGDTTKWQNSGECDCAFVKKTGSESTIFGTWYGINTSNSLSSKSDASLGNYVMMIGYTSSIQVGKVYDIDYDTTGSPSIENTMRVSYQMSSGDSGGSVIDFATANKYQGLIKGGNTGYTIIIPWSHIDNALDIN